MLPGSTLFLDVGSQQDLWPGGAWPLVTVSEAAKIAYLFRLAATLGIRQGGIICLHPAPSADHASPGPPHCLRGSSAVERPASCEPILPTVVCETDAAIVALLQAGRAQALYVTSGCAGDPDAAPLHRAVLDHLSAGIRDAVVFGAGLEFAVDRAVAALARRRIRTHVALDAVGTADAVTAQQVIAVWKRRAVDVATTGTIERLLRRRPAVAN